MKIEDKLSLIAQNYDAQSPSQQTVQQAADRLKNRYTHGMGTGALFFPELHDLTIFSGSLEQHVRQPSKLVFFDYIVDEHNVIQRNGSKSAGLKFQTLDGKLSMRLRNDEPYDVVADTRMACWGDPDWTLFDIHILPTGETPPNLHLFAPKRGVIFSQPSVSLTGVYCDGMRNHRKNAILHLPRLDEEGVIASTWQAVAQELKFQLEPTDQRVKGEVVKDKHEQYFSNNWYSFEANGTRFVLGALNLMNKVYIVSATFQTEKDKQYFERLLPIVQHGEISIDGKRVAFTHPRDDWSKRIYTPPLKGNQLTYRSNFALSSELVPFMTALLKTD